ncbi:unnamed protein product [Lasius platythorax]|uniref:Uncharacterized protein n=1 Tax=Lasius platythorax TaxID=488582 RepID=A0AAV2N2Y3_9HYME
MHKIRRGVPDKSCRTWVKLLQEGVGNLSRSSQGIRKEETYRGYSQCTGFTILPICISCTVSRFYMPQLYSGVFLKLCAVYDGKRDTKAVISRKNSAEFSFD